jgi:predicted kinase
MSHTPTAYLIYGPTAAGKSTYARKLASEKQAVRFAVDEWMHALFAPDKPEKLDMAWVMPRVARCQAHIWATSQQTLAVGKDVVLEPGLLRANDRDRMRSLVEAAGYQAVFHFVDADLPLRRQRVVQRNAEKGDTYSFDVTPAMFDFMESYFERPTALELARSTVITQGENHG